MLDAPANPGPRVAVVVPVRDDPDNLRACLRALSACDPPPDAVVVVDDASRDLRATADVVEAAGAGGLPVRFVRLDAGRGAAGARNAAVQALAGEASDVIFCVDADVEAAPGAVGVVRRLMAERPDVAAAFGCYDEAPGHPAFVSQYKNLAHRLTHLAAGGWGRNLAPAGTFWSGCGAVRAEAFREVGGFDPKVVGIEDIEMGMRLRAAGHTVVIEKSLQGKHLKRWTLPKLVATDVTLRALPWARLLRSRRRRTGELNLGVGQKVAAGLTGLSLLLVLAAGGFWPPVLLMPVVAAVGVLLADALTARGPRPNVVNLTGFAVAAWALLTPAYASFTERPVAGALSAAAVACVACVVLLNLRFFAEFVRLRGPGFAVLCVAMHLLYYLYSAASLAWVAVTPDPAGGRASPPPVDRDVSSVTSPSA